MPALKVAKLGNPVLRQIAEPVDLEALTGPRNSEIQQFMDDLIDTMRQEVGVGIAAPQVARSIQIIVVEYEENERYPGENEIPLMVLVNPTITWMSEEKIQGWESCLSLIDLRGLVTRSKEVTVEAYTRDGEKIVIDASGFMAVVLQHEIDHLAGKVFLDRMTDLSQLAYQEEFQKFWKEEAPVKI